MPEARRWLITGRVQGVGFRPFVYQLARAHHLSGWVRNLTGQVEILAQGEPASLDRFAVELLATAPPLSRPVIEQCITEPAQLLSSFEIAASQTIDRVSIHVPPDSAPCPDCLRELQDATDRRHRYPFINCTQCGPRYTLIRGLPYDRAQTAMAGFPLCPQCARDYHDPQDRRFHAEVLACPVCGPQLQFYSEEPGVVNDNHAALAAALAALRAGLIVAVKGIGGYHLLCDAGHSTAIARLRKVKPRPHKPLAVMFPLAGEDGLDQVRAATRLEAADAAMLLEPTRPIVLLRKRQPFPLSGEIAPGLNEIGVLLPYSPLHQMLLAGFGAPVVATSGNIGGEPVLTDTLEAESRLLRIADAFLHHDRPILRPAEDPVFRPLAGRARPLRLGRGIAPLELILPRPLDRPLLAVGGHMKNSVALAWDQRVVVSPHIGDLGTPRSRAVFEQVIADLQDLYGVRAEQLVGDAHPGYASSRYARASSLPFTPVLHHHAHASALAGEHADVGRWLVFAWDGVGLGEDGRLWGGEALLGSPGLWQRLASLREFSLPGGDQAARAPWRSALALCWEAGLDWKSAPPVPALLHDAWQRGLNSPRSSAAGRLFDGAAALLGLNLDSSYEGQAPMLLEAACRGTAEPVELPLARDADGLWRSDWSPLLPVLMDDARPVSARAACFHASLAQALGAQAERLRETRGDFVVGLTGGVFQNRVLIELALENLKTRGFETRLTQQLPCNDGGLCYGQVIELGARAGQGDPSR